MIPPASDQDLSLPERTYDTDQGGYVVDLDKEVLEKAPHYRSGGEPTFDRDYGREVSDYYGVTYPY